MLALILVARSGRERFELSVTETAITIGRAATNDVVLDDPQISRQHAQIVLVERRAMVSDLGSKNGTSLNGEPVLGPLELRDCDVLRFGALEFQVQAADARTRSIGRSRTKAETVTVLFTDLEGHTRLFEELGTDGAYAVVTQHIGVMRDEVLRDGGTVVKTEGDGLIATFASVRSAIGCAVAIQRRTRAIEATARSVPVRIGINTGDAIREDDDVLGMAVIKAARVMAHAAGGEILISEVSRMLLGPSQDLQVIAKGWFSLKGVSRRERLYQVRWRSD